MFVPSCIATLFYLAQFCGANKPHIVFILADDLGFSDVEYVGEDGLGQPTDTRLIKTPHIKELAESGVILENYYVQPICTPTRSALLTGKYPINTGTQEGVIQHTEPWGLDLNEKIMPEYMKEKGYKTHIVGKWHLGFYNEESTPVNRGFDSFFGFYNSGSDYFTHESAVSAFGGRYNGLDLHRDTPNNLQPDFTHVGQNDYSSKMYGEEARQIIANHDTNKPDEPLFLYFPIQSVHGPRQSDSDCEDRFDSIINDPDRKIMAGMLACMDDAVGVVKQALIDNNKMMDNTIIIFSSDNGGKVKDKLSSNYPLRGEKGTVWEGGVRVPGFISSPLLANPGTTFKDLFHVTDWLPTLVKLTGNSFPSTHKGLPLFVSGVDQWDHIQGVASGSARDTILLNIKSNHEALIHKDIMTGKTWKIISDSSGDQTWQEPPDSHVSNSMCNGVEPATPTRCSNKHCLFDLGNDPCEYNNVRRSNAQTYRKLRDLLNDYRLGIPHAIVASRKQPADPDSDPALSGYSISVWMPWKP